MPSRRPASAISAESVLRIVRSTTPECRAASAAYSISSRPASGRRFLPGTPFDPPRAGTMARTASAVVINRLACGVFCTRRTSRSSASTEAASGSASGSGAAGRHR